MGGFDIDDPSGFSEEKYEVEEGGVEESVDEAENADPVAALMPDGRSRVVSEVERRFALAECYKQILQTDIFDQKTPATAAVQEEIADFCQRRMEVLLGIKPEGRTASPVESPFSDDEVQILKALASRVKAAAAPKESPALNKVAAPAPPPPQAPTVRRAPAPARKPPPIASLPSAQQPVKKRATRRIRMVDGVDMYSGKPKKIKQDLTRQVGEQSNPNAIPFPNKDQFEAVMAVKAQQEAAMVAKKVPAHVHAGVAKTIQEEQE